MSAPEEEAALDAQHDAEALAIYERETAGRPTTHATAGDLCTDACRHLCPACENGYPEACEDLFEDPIAGVVACMSDELVS